MSNGKPTVSECEGLAHLATLEEILEDLEAIPATGNVNAFQIAAAHELARRVRGLLAGNESRLTTTERVDRARAELDAAEAKNPGRPHPAERRAWELELETLEAERCNRADQLRHAAMAPHRSAWALLFPSLEPELAVRPGLHVNYRAGHGEITPADKAAELSFTAELEAQGVDVWP